MVFGNRGFSVALLTIGAIVFCWVLLLALSTAPSGAQSGVTAGSTSASTNASQSDEGCTNPETVDILTGTENQITDSFEIIGDTFRLSYDITDIEDASTFDSFLIRAVDEDGLQVGDSVLVFDEGSDTVNILEGPGTFTLEIESDGFDYEVTIEDCTGDSGDDGGNTNGGNTNGGNRTVRGGETIIVRTIPRKGLPPTGGSAVYAMVGGSVLTGAGLLAVGIATQRGRQR